MFFVAPGLFYVSTCIILRWALKRSGKAAIAPNLHSTVVRQACVSCHPFLYSS